MLTLSSSAAAAASSAAASASTSSSSSSTPSRADSLQLSIHGSPIHLSIDKPQTLLGIRNVPGSGLLFSKKGLAYISSSPTPPTPSSAAGSGNDSSSLLPPSSLYSLPESVREQVRRYALLVHVLNGNVVNAQTIAGGAWELESMIEQLGTSTNQAASSSTTTTSMPQHRATSSSSSSSSSSSVRDDANFWKKFLDKKTGREYYWHELTNRVQWETPKGYISK